MSFMYRLPAAPPPVESAEAVSEAALHNAGPAAVLVSLAVGVEPPLGLEVLVADAEAEAEAEADGVALADPVPVPCAW